MYHGWTYDLDGRLVNVPKRDAYGPQFRPEDLGLAEVPQVATYCGIVFVCFGGGAPAIEEHLAEAAAFIEMAIGSAECEAIGSQRYEYDGNWKTHLENTIDGQHGFFLHRLYAQSGLLTVGESRQLGRGHGLLRWKAGAAQGDSGRLMGLDRTGALDTDRVLIVYPNLALIHIQDLINLRVIVPLTMGRTRVYATALGLRGDPPELRSRRALQLSAAQGPAGMAGADDIEVFEAVQDGCAADGEEIAWLDISRGYQPGEIAGELDDETALRGQYREWRRLMADGARG
jgi:phenylpropionate dioxygenase-like ring-hydroxylating dioxygenase large terminal subunit